MLNLVVFRVDARHFGLPIEQLVRVVRAVEIQPLPGAPSSVLGMVNVAGQVAPVFDLRPRLGLPQRSVAFDSQFVITRAGARVLVLVVDMVCGVVECSQADVVAGAALVPGAVLLRGVAKVGRELILVEDLETLLSGDEVAALERALAAVAKASAVGAQP